MALLSLINSFYRHCVLQTMVRRLNIILEFNAVWRKWALVRCLPIRGKPFNSPFFQIILEFFTDILLLNEQVDLYSRKPCVIYSIRLCTTTAREILNRFHYIGRSNVTITDDCIYPYGRIQRICQPYQMYSFTL